MTPSPGWHSAAAARPSAASRNTSRGSTIVALAAGSLLQVSTPLVVLMVGLAVAGFGQLLEGSIYLGDWGWSDAIALATGAKGDDPYGYRAEAVGLMRLGKSLAGH